MKKVFQLTLFSLLLAVSLQSQCYDNRHNTSENATWISCSATPSPNPIRGTSHWIMYNLGLKYPLGRLELWNNNNPQNLDNGIQNLKIDISNNGQDWTEVATFTLPKASSSGFYEGVTGPNLNGHEARFVLITAMDNYGGPCYSLSEIRIGLSNVPDPCSNFDITVDNDPIYDGLYHVAEEINSAGLIDATGNVQFKAGDVVTLNNGFTVLDGADFTAEIEDCNY